MGSVHGFRGVVHADAVLLADSMKCVDSADRYILIVLAVCLSPSASAVNHSHKWNTVTIPFGLPFRFFQYSQYCLIADP